MASPAPCWRRQAAADTAPPQERGAGAGSHQSCTRIDGGAIRRESQLAHALPVCLLLRGEQRLQRREHEAMQCGPGRHHAQRLQRLSPVEANLRAIEQGGTTAAGQD